MASSLQITCSWSTARRRLVLISLPRPLRLYRATFFGTLEPQQPMPLALTYLEFPPSIARFKAISFVASAELEPSQPISVAAIVRLLATPFPATRRTSHLVAAAMSFSTIQVITRLVLPTTQWEHRHSHIRQSQPGKPIMSGAPVRSARLRSVVRL